MLGSPEAGRRYGIIVGIEFAIAGLGATALALRGRGDLMAPWVAVVVGAHFWPLARVLRDRSLIPLGAVLVIAGLGGAAIGLTADTAPSAIVGLVAGVSLLLVATADAVAAGRSA